MTAAIAQKRSYAGNVIGLSATNGKVVQMLNDRGADVDAQGRICDTALRGASYNGHGGMERTLLRSRAK